MQDPTGRAPGIAHTYMKVTVTRQQGLTLAQQLEATGVALDLRCGGQGTCGRCRVRLIEGALLLDGRPVAAQADVPAAALAPANGRIAAGWQCVPLPRTPETVIAVDIGTTTLAAVKVRQGEVLAIAGCSRRWGWRGFNGSPSQATPS